MYTWTKITPKINLNQSSIFRKQNKKLWQKTFINNSIRVKLNILIFLFGSEGKSRGAVSNTYKWM